MTLIHHCLDCGTATRHRHLNDVTAGRWRNSHVFGSERFICTACDRTTFAWSPGAATFRFVCDGIANERVRA